MSIESKVKAMYNAVPFPTYGDKPLTERYQAEKEFIDLTCGYDEQGFDVYNDKVMIEAGCGTGRESLYLASKGAKLTAIDIAAESLKVARRITDTYDLKHKINFQQGSVLDIPFDDNSFEIALSSGVIHHTDNPERAFSELARVLKPGGYLILFVYNPFAHFIPNIRRGIVTTLAGENIHRRVAFAKILFPLYLRKVNIGGVYDEFAHPHKSEHSIKQVLSWFEKYGIEYNSAYPKFGIGGFMQTIKNRSHYYKTKEFRKVDEEYYSPTLKNRFFSSIFQLLRGFRNYSGGYRMVGIKK